MMNNLRQQWVGRSVRERGLVTVLCFLAAVSLLWAGLWQPLCAAIAAQEQRQEQLRTTAQKIARLPVRKRADASLETILRQRAVAQGIRLISTEIEKTKMRVKASSPEGDALLAWILTLETQDAAVLLDIDIQLQPDADVTANVLLERR